MTTFVRAYHTANAETPIFSDPLAAELMGPKVYEELRTFLIDLLAIHYPHLAEAGLDQASSLAAVLRTVGPNILGRARLNEEYLEESIARGTSQYLILGAGMDTFAFRRPDLADRLQVFEVDHPDTQQFKLERIADLGWKMPANLHHLAIDFNSQQLDEVLLASDFNPTRPVFISWLGVLYYLPRDAIFNTLRCMSTCVAPDSELTFDYFDQLAFAPGSRGKRMERVRAGTSLVGEPMVTGLDPLALAADLAQVGFELELDLAPAGYQARVFGQRPDGYLAKRHTHFALARRSGGEVALPE
jgi:methyltransferase (TIGR00027 family)